MGLVEGQVAHPASSFKIDFFAIFPRFGVMGLIEVNDAFSPFMDISKLVFRYKFSQYYLQYFLSEKDHPPILESYSRLLAHSSKGVMNIIEGLMRWLIDYE